MPNQFNISSFRRIVRGFAQNEKSITIIQRILQLINDLEILWNAFGKLKFNWKASESVFEGKCVINQKLPRRESAIRKKKPFPEMHASGYCSFNTRKRTIEDEINIQRQEKLRVMNLLPWRSLPARTYRTHEKNNGITYDRNLIGRFRTNRNKLRKAYKGLFSVIPSSKTTI